MRVYKITDPIFCPECGEQLDGEAGDYAVFKKLHVEICECEFCYSSIAVEMKDSDNVIVSSNEMDCRDVCC